MLKIGEVVPDMEFQVFHENSIKKMNFKDFRGRWLVLLFYPADFTFICPTELEDAANNYQEFLDQGAEVLSISTDTVFTHKAWHETSSSIKKIKYPMVSDPTGNICKLFGTYIDEEGLSLRGTFIINPDGVLKMIDIHDNSIGRSSKEILRRLKAAVFVSRADGEVCPANWEPGKKTLRPGLDLVGKI